MKKSALICIAPVSHFCDELEIFAVVLLLPNAFLEAQCSTAMYAQTTHSLVKEVIQESIIIAIYTRKRIWDIWRMQPCCHGRVSRCSNIEIG